MTFDELIQKYYFNYNEEAIAYLIEEHNFTYDYAQLLLKNLLAIENKVYKTDKLNKLKTLKEELEERNLLIKDDYFKDYLKRFELFHTGSAHDKLSKNLLIKIKAKEINKTKTLIANKELLLFDTLAEECEYLYQKIAELLHDGVKLNEIKVLGLDDAYNKHSVRLSDFFGIYFNNIKKPLSSYHFVKSYLDRKSTLLNSSHFTQPRTPPSA